MKDKKPVAERVLAALKEHGSLTLESLAKHADTTVASLYTMMGTLKKKHGVAKLAKYGKGPRVYGLAGKDTPPQRKDQLAAGAELGRKPQKKAKKKKAARPIAPTKAPSKAAHSRPAPTNGDARFAINEQGELGIEKEGQKLGLDGVEFARLREFIERTQPVWEGAEPA